MACSTRSALLAPPLTAPMRRWCHPPLSWRRWLTREGTWSVTDLDEVVFEAPLAEIRVSILWKADVYVDEAHRRQIDDNPLSLTDVAARIAGDLAARGEDIEVDPAHFDDPDHAATYRPDVPLACANGSAPIHVRQTLSGGLTSQVGSEACNRVSQWVAELWVNASTIPACDRLPTEETEAWRGCVRPPRRAARSRGSQEPPTPPRPVSWW